MLYVMVLDNVEIGRIKDSITQMIKILKKDEYEYPEGYINSFNETFRRRRIL